MRENNREKIIAALPTYSRCVIEVFIIKNPLIISSPSFFFFRGNIRLNNARIIDEEQQ
jgi:hypothetical protein